MNLSNPGERHNFLVKEQNEEKISTGSQCSTTQTLSVYIYVHVTCTYVCLHVLNLLGL